MSSNSSGRANRVAPNGSCSAVADRGLFWGNRGRLLDRHGGVARHFDGRRWICCLLEFSDRHRRQWQPNRLTELYFLDEATALAAGHRPCGECRHADYRRFAGAWARAFPDSPVSAGEIDRRLHADRIADGRHRTHVARQRDLPDGTIVALDDGFWLVAGDRVRHWSFGGYDDWGPRSSLPRQVTVQTPEATVEVLRSGFAPVVHPSAQHS